MSQCDTKYEFPGAIHNRKSPKITTGLAGVPLQKQTAPKSAQNQAKLIEINAERGAIFVAAGHNGRDLAGGDAAAAGIAASASSQQGPRRPSWITAGPGAALLLTFTLGRS
jgi:hypothetical protein